MQNSNRERNKRRRSRVMALIAAASLLLVGYPTLKAEPGAPAGKEREKGAQNRTFLWKVESQTTTVYLLGSLHVAPPSIFPLAPPIEKAYRESEVLVVEADIGKGRAKLAGAVQKYGMYPNGRGLKAALPEQTYQALLKELSGVGLSPAQVEGMRPWMVAMTLSVVRMAGLGYSQAHGIDNYFLNRARGRKPIEQLESAEFQMRLFGTFPPAVEVAFLEQTIHELPTIDKTLNGMFEAWKKGDAATMEKLVLPKTKSPLAREIDERIYYARNRTMAAKIRKYLAGKRRIFVVVGAGHLIGDGGIPALLKKNGAGGDTKYAIKRY